MLSHFILVLATASAAAAQWSAMDSERHLRAKNKTTTAPGTAAPRGDIHSGTWPTSTGLVQYDKPYVVKAGETFDGGMKTYERSNVQCEGQKEGGPEHTVFLLEPGATLKNAIIGKNQREGVHCDKHDCTIDNVWWDDVCEDAFTIKGGTASSVTHVRGCGARHAEDKVIQHNGPGKVVIDGFYAQDFGKLYRSCGTCGNIQRQVAMSNVLAVSPKVSVVTINENFKDHAVLDNIRIENKNKATVCAWTEGTDGKSEPKKIGDGSKPGLCDLSSITEQ
ncbi:TPA: hypothetical protein N0F65_005039 [Lagenidium giganteum]|uniref:Probable pectate lyase F n=1 Tax=Lagenidium giganteum TaxID=4803 RepID=A0AAV2ZLD8_9STRA|nr:TPA: hypothetical protein N0F65_005039 [Lagenidium giganteum]